VAFSGHRRRAPPLVDHFKRTKPWGYREDVDHEEFRFMHDGSVSNTISVALEA